MRSMTFSTIRKFVYAALLAFATLNFLPSLAAAQEPAQGKFTLSHEVHWGNTIVPAGEYGFSFDPAATPHVLTLSKLSGARTGFMLLVPATEEAKPSDSSRILLETTSDGSYVSAMQLPEFGMTLEFTVPAHPMTKQIAKATSEASTSAQ